MAKKPRNIEIVEEVAEKELSRAERKQAEKDRKKKEAQEKKREQRMAAKKKSLSGQETATTLQATIPYRTVYSNGVIETEKGTYTKSYMLKDVNYQAAKIEDQQTMFLKYSELLNSFDPSVKLQISVNNRNIDQERFKEDTLLPKKGNKLDVYIEEYNDMLVDKMSKGKNNTARDKYLTISVEAESFDAACNIFSRLDTEIVNTTKKIGGSEAKELSAVERLAILHNLLNIGHENEFEIDKEDTERWLRDLTMRGWDTKDVIVPNGIEFKKGHIEIGDKFARVLYLKELPSYLPDVIISDLTDCEHNMITSLNISVIPQDRALKIVRNQMTNINSNIVDKQQKAAKSGYDPNLIGHELKKAQEDANELLENLTSKDQKMFQMTLVIMHFADTIEQLDKDTESIITVGRKYSCDIKKLFSQQELGFKSALPLCYNQLLMKRTLTTASTAVFMPFTSQELNQKNGRYYGLNKISNNLILFNRETCKNGNGFILGTPGCVDRETEFFNGKEWKSIADYQEGEMVLQFNADTNEASLVLPERYIKAPCDKMYHFETGYGVNMTLSPEHRVLYRTYLHRNKTFSEMKEMSAEELYQQMIERPFHGRIQTSFEYEGPGINLTDNEIKVMLAVICDGHFDKRYPDNNYCSISLKKERKIKELRKLLTEWGEPFKESNVRDSYTNFYFKAPRIEKEFLPYWYQCNRHQLQVVCENVLKWDGCVTRGMQFITTVKNTADFVQFAFSACGYRANIVCDDRKAIPRIVNGVEYKNRAIVYQVNIAKNNMAGFVYKDEDGINLNAPMVVEPKDGMKYCFTVPTHALVLRRKDRIFITGNSGKSFATKQEMANVILGTDDDIIVIDPENEYCPLIELLDGEIISIDAGGHNYINPLDMDASYAGEKGKDPIVLKTDFVLSLCETVCGYYGGITPSQKSIVDRCVRAVYRDYLASEYIDEYGEKRYDETKVPTLLDFQKLLASQSDREAREIALSLELYTAGSLDNFAHRTNVDVDNRFIAYNLRDVGDNMMTMAMLVIMDSIWNRILRNHRLGKKTWVYVDEAHLLFANRTSATFLRTLYKRSRKFNGYITCITQNVSDILENPICKTMIGNSEFLILLNQSADDRDKLTEQLGLSDTQLSAITAANPGEGLLINTPNIIPFVNKFPKDTELYKAMTTKPSDLAEYRKEKEAAKKKAAGKE